MQELAITFHLCRGAFLGEECCSKKAIAGKWKAGGSLKLIGTLGSLVRGIESLYGLHFLQGQGVARRIYDSGGWNEELI